MDRYRFQTASSWRPYEIKLAADPHALEAFLRALADAGVSAFHCSTRRFWEPEFPDTGSDLNLAGWTRKLSGLPTITVGSVGLIRADSVGERRSTVEPSLENLDLIARGLERGDFDLVAVGRALLANPDWSQLIRDGRFEAVAPYTGAALDELI